MGLFDKRPPCAICGGKVKGLLPWKIEGNYICNDCYGVVDAQDGNSFNMKQFLEYRDFREQNHALKDQFHIDETVEFGFFSEKFVFDYQNNLFCMDKGLDRTIFHGSELESFLISEDGAPLLEGSARGYIRHQSTVPQRINDLLPQMNQLLLQQQMQETLERITNRENDTPTASTCPSRSRNSTSSCISGTPTGSCGNSTAPAPPSSGTSPTSTSTALSITRTWSS